MAQYYQCVVQNVEDLKRMYPTLNLDNCVVMNEDGTQFGSQQVFFDRISTEEKIGFLFY